MKQALPWILLIIILLLAGVFLLMTNPPLPSLEPTVKKAAVSHEEHPLNSPSKTLSPQEAKAAHQSLQQMTLVLLNYTVAEKKLEDLMEDLKKSGQQPFMVRDKNPYTGEMTLVRTKSPLPGTRYFHAQYFTDEAFTTFAQHMSFELRPSPEAMNQAIAMVREIFPNLQTPTDENRDFIQWNLEHGYVLWIKRLGLEDFEDNPFNFYSSEDVGSIRIAVELTPEGR